MMSINRKRPIIRTVGLENKHNYKSAKRLILLILISSFGPYFGTGYGLRLEHLVIYGCTILIAFRLMIKPHYKIDPNLVFLSLAFSCAGLWMLVVTAFSDTIKPAYGIVAGFENLIQPAAIIFSLGVAVSGLKKSELMNLLYISTFTVIVLLLFNTLISIANIFFDTWPLARHFVSELPFSLLETVWGHAASMGRYSGIFNQPLEAGIAYSLGAISWAYWNIRRGRTTSFSWIGLGAIVVGGLLTVSKIFIFGGLPLGLAFWIWLSPRNAFKVNTIAKISLLVIASILIFSSWQGLPYLEWHLSTENISDEGLINLFSAGRFGGENPIIGDLFREVWTKAPIQGFGYAAFTPLDNAFLEFFYQGGLVGLVICLSILIVIIHVLYRALKTSKPEGAMIGLLLIIVLGASMGASAMTLNRCSTLLWVLFSLLIEYVSIRRNRDPGIRRSTCMEEKSIRKEGPFL